MARGDGETVAPALTTGAIALLDELRNRPMEVLDEFDLAGSNIVLKRGADTFWAFVIPASGSALALRLAQWPAGSDTKIRKISADLWRVSGVTGTYDVKLFCEKREFPLLQFEVTLIPSSDLSIPYIQRDLYPLDLTADPGFAEGTIDAAQRGLNGAVLFARFDQPDAVRFLYFQDLTALNPYFQTTCTSPDAAMGGQWPEIGFLLPTPPQTGTPLVAPLAKGKPYVISNAILTWRNVASSTEKNNAVDFLQMLGAAYRCLQKPKVEFRDWKSRAEKTYQNLSRSRKASVRYRGRQFIRPYTDAEYPDSMVQMAVLATMSEYKDWSGKNVPLTDRLAAGLRHFYDGELRTIRRYLPNVGEDKDADAVDSWYLYHPLLNLGRLAQKGDENATNLLLDAIDFAIKSARHFNYRWPIQFNVKNFKIITATRGDERHGQTDVGGLYAMVMLQAFALTGQARFLDEAKAAIDAALGSRFELEYQANLTAWGAAACVRLWRISSDAKYLQQAYTFLASFFHNCVLWDSELNNARYYNTFLGATCLHDAPYMAIYECYEAFLAFEQLLMDAGPEMEPAARLLVSEYCRYALHRAWFYYPDALPPEILSEEVRNGHIDSGLSFPLEDLYAGGDPPGQVGQEIYGAGAALAFATRSFHSVEGKDFHLYCDYFLVREERSADNEICFDTVGGERSDVVFCMVRTGGSQLPMCGLSASDGTAIDPFVVKQERVEFRLKAGCRYILRWNGQAGGSISNSGEKQ